MYSDDRTSHNGGANIDRELGGMEARLIQSERTLNNLEEKIDLLSLTLNKGLTDNARDHGSVITELAVLSNKLQAVEKSVKDLRFEFREFNQSIEKRLASVGTRYSSPSKLALFLAAIIGAVAAGWSHVSDFFSGIKPPH